MGVGLSVLAALALERMRRADGEEAHGGEAQLTSRGVGARLGLRDGEDAISGIDRMREEQIQVAIDAIQDAPSGSAVHDARKALKRARTLERLAQRRGGASSCGGRRAGLSCAGDALAQARDADVALSTLEEILAKDKKLARRPSVKRLRDLLAAERLAAARALTSSPARTRALGVLAALLEEVAEERAPKAASGREASGREAYGPDAAPEARIPRHDALDAAAAADLPRQARRVYARGIRAMRRAKRRGSVASMHEWRKQVKELRYLAEALSTPGKTPSARRMKKMRRRSTSLGEALGEEHDLAMLAVRVKAERRLFKADRASRKRLLRLIDRRRRDLRRRALRLGAKLYARSPKRAMRRVGIS